VLSLYEKSDKAQPELLVPRLCPYVISDNPFYVARGVVAGAGEGHGAPMLCQAAPRVCGASFVRGRGGGTRRALSPYPCGLRVRHFIGCICRRNFGKCCRPPLRPLCVTRPRQDRCMATPSTLQQPKKPWTASKPRQPFVYMSADARRRCESCSVRR
jgi:hypothetical protein